VRRHTPHVPAAPADHGDPRDRRVCPPCGEPVRRTPPTSPVPWAAHQRPAPRWSHPDGEPLCPVVADPGYRPAEPAEAA
jgi:hypothetical protein